MMKSHSDVKILLKYEHDFINCGKNIIAGMDEVGRGCLAGPVVVACVVMPLDEHNLIDGINDSKQLSKAKRESLYKQIVEKAKEITICSCDNVEIDNINILEATKKCMKNCIEALETNCDVVLVDAVKLFDTKYPTYSIVKGDALSYSIAAASIVAKVTRDNLMKEYDKEFPQYGFLSNVGYGTAKHVAALQKYGYCKIHRKTFIKNFFTGEQLGFKFEAIDKV